MTHFTSVVLGVFCKIFLIRERKRRGWSSVRALACSVVQQRGRDVRAGEACSVRAAAAEQQENCRCAHTTAGRESYRGGN